MNFTRRVFVRKIYQLYSVRTMKPRDLAGKLLGIPVTPARPEAALSTVVAEVRTAARELHDDDSLTAIVAVALVVDELPAHSIGVEIIDHPRGRGFGDYPIATKRNAAHSVKLVCARLDRGHQPRDGCLSLSADDHIDLWLFGEHLAVVIGRIYAAIDDRDSRQLSSTARCQLRDDRVCRRRPECPIGST